MSKSGFSVGPDRHRSPPTPLPQGQRGGGAVGAADDSQVLVPALPPAVLLAVLFGVLVDAAELCLMLVSAPQPLQLEHLRSGGRRIAVQTLGKTQAVLFATVQRVIQPATVLSW